MRVLLMRRKRTERGVVAVMVALLAVSLLVMGAIVIDFGMAYVNKNRTQEAADAGALAAGKVYAAAKASCSLTGQITNGDPVEALKQADEVRKANMPNSKDNPAALTVSCEDAMTSAECTTLSPCQSAAVLKIRYDVQADSPVGLGAIVSDQDHITVNRHAAVKWGTSEKAPDSLRPWMLCSAQIPAQPFTDKVYEVSLPGNGHKPAPDTCGVNQPGDWWRLKCPGGGSSNNDSENAVLYGCPAVTIVPGSAGVTDPVERTHILLHECNPKYVGPLWKYDAHNPDKNKYVEKTDCLARDSGRDVKNLDTAWKTLLGKTIAVPVFCAGTDCTPSSVVSDEPKATWPVWKIAAVTVCGYGLHGAKSPNLSMVSSECNINNTDGLNPATTFDGDDLGFLLIFKGIIESGDSTSLPPETKTTMRLAE